MIKPGPRILFYSHDTFGLGHLRRTLAIAHQLYRDLHQVHQLVLTGSMVAGAFSLPPRVDLIKLPALTKRSSGEYKARALPLSLCRTLSWREQMILETVRHFRPDLLLVDKAAGGVHGELLPALRDIKTWQLDTKLVLGMRDIEDSPQATRAEWTRQNIYHLLDHIYDRILLYGQRDLFDPVQAYGMSPIAAAKLVCCGYLRRTGGQRSPEAIRWELGVSGKPLVVVTVGGGGDGFAVIEAFLEMMAWSNKPWDALVITGPLMAQSKQAQLQCVAAQAGIPLVAFTPDLASYLAAADLVVSMAGYNTVCEILALGKRALLIPRTKVRAEQRLRAEALARRQLVTMLLPVDLSPRRFAQAIEGALGAPAPAVDLEFNGLERASAAIRTLLQLPAKQSNTAHCQFRRRLLDQERSLRSRLLLPAITGGQAVHDHDQEETQDGQGQSDANLGCEAVG